MIRNPRSAISSRFCSFASNSMHVSMWEVVSNYNSHYRVKGTIPSDHNMIRADLKLG